MHHPTAPRAERRYVKGPTGQIHLYDTGGDGTPLVLLHQAPTSSMDFAPLFPAFARAGQRLIAIDTPGFGMSDPPEAVPTILDYADAVLTVLDALDVPTAHFLGHHTGVKVAVEFAAAHPERTGKLVLYGSALSSPETRQAMWDSMVPREQEGRLHKPEPDGGHLIDQFQRQAAYAGPEAGHRMFIATLMAGPKWWYGHNAAILHDQSESYMAVQAPVLLVANPGEMLEEGTVAMAAKKPGARLARLKTHGAMAMDTDPEEFVAAVMAFLRED